MRWTQKRISKFREAPLNQLSRSNPWTYFFVAFAFGVFGAASALDVIALISGGTLSHMWYQKYVVGVAVATGSFFGQKHIWTKIEANKALDGTSQ